jgi:hypothetical protein
VIGVGGAASGRDVGADVDDAAATIVVVVEDGLAAAAAAARVEDVGSTRSVVARFLL